MKVLIFLSLLFFGFHSQASSIYVAPVQGTNIQEGQLKTLRELVKVQVQNQKNHQLVHDLKKADYYIQTKIIKFNSYTLSMTKWQNNKKINQGQWRAQNLAELENTIATAVSELSQKNSGDIGQEINNPPQSLGEQAEQKKKNSNFERVQASRQVMVAFGPTYFNNMNTSSTGLGFQAAYVWNINDHVDLGLQSEFAISTDHSDAFLFDGKIITNYFFLAQDVSPFVGAGFGYGWASIHDNNTALITDDTAGGFALSLQAGVKFFRTSTVNFAVSGEYTNIFDSSSLGEPGVFMLKVALYY